MSSKHIVIDARIRRASTGRYVDRLVERLSERQGRGRPPLRFQLTERGDHLFPVRDGVLAVAGPEHFPLLVDWTEAMHAEALPNAPAPDAARMVGLRIEQGDIFLWTEAGAPLGMAARTRSVAPAITTEEAQAARAAAAAIIAPGTGAHNSAPMLPPPGPDLMNTRPVLPRPNRNPVTRGDLPDSPLGEIEDDGEEEQGSEVAGNRKRGGGRLPGAGEPENEDTVAKAEPTPDPAIDPTQSFPSGDDINKRPIVDLANHVNDLRDETGLNLQGAFIIKARGRLDKDGKIGTMPPWFIERGVEPIVRVRQRGDCLLQTRAFSLAIAHAGRRIEQHRDAVLLEEHGVVVEVLGDRVRRHADGRAQTARRLPG